jgi:hypothetical protein
MKPSHEHKTRLSILFVRSLGVENTAHVDKKIAPFILETYGAQEFSQARLSPASLIYGLGVPPSVWELVQQ